MGRTKGSKNKAVKVPDVVVLNSEAKIALLADLLVGIAIKEDSGAEPSS